MQVGSDRETLRRSTSTDHSSQASGTQASEPRGLNARGSAASSTERNDRDRPRLFQRASSGSFGRNDGLTSGVIRAGGAIQLPALSRERFSGIQGGVLSGVAPPERRRKESEVIRSAKAAPGGEEIGALPERKPGSNAQPVDTTVRSGKVKPALDGLALSASSAPAEATAFKPLTPRSVPAAPTASSPWSSRRRDRGPGDGPIGPPPESAAGLCRFAGYDRKRERTGGSNANSWRYQSSSGRASQLTAGQLGGTGASEDEMNGAPVGATDIKSIAHSPSPQPSQTILQSLDALNLDHGGSAPHELKDDPQWSTEMQQWLYRDPTGQVQGPFAASLMQSWYEGKYFTDELMIRPEEEPEFRPLAAYVVQSGHDPRLFLRPPPTFDQPQPRDEANGPTQPAHLTGERDQHPISQSQIQPQLGSLEPTHFNEDVSLNFHRSDVSGSFQGSLAQAPNGAARWEATRVSTQPAWLGHQLGATGFASGIGAPFASDFGELPQSPFAAHLGLPASPDPYSLDARLRQQEEYFAMIRKPEAEGQAADGRGAGGGLSFGQLSAIDGFGGPSGWPQAASQQRDLWGREQIALQHEQGGGGGEVRTPQTPWGASAPLRDSQQQQPQTPWNDSEAQQHYVGVIGTPVRSRSPAQPAQTDQKPIASPEVAVSPERADSRLSFRILPAGGHTPKGAADLGPSVEIQQNITQSTNHRPMTPQPVDPAPEQDWPQSPSAVEFASQPDFEWSTAARSEPEKKDARNASFGGSTMTRQATGAGASSKNMIPSAAGVNVKVVQADQFRKSNSAAAETPEIQAPLNGFMVNGHAASPGGTPTMPSAAKVAPWAQSTSSEDTQGVTATMTLREIQELEAKQAEARRIAEKAAAQRRAAAGAGLRTLASESLPTTMSWGLASIPSSVNKAQSAAGVLDRAPSPVTPSQPAAWTGAAGGRPKKTLTEIQEEERKRAMSAQRKAAAVMSASKASAEALGPRPSGSGTTLAQQVSAAGPGWSVVGVGGKPTTPAPSSAAAAAVNTRPTPVGPSQKNASTASIPGVVSADAPWGSVNGFTATKPSAVQLPSSAAVHSGFWPRTATGSLSGSEQINTSSSSSSDLASKDSNSPSAEFIKYCREQFQGLCGVKMDDFIEMLFSFPLDPSPDVIEIIAESIYAHSSTLDGRRLANDFVAKRKLDAGVRDKSGGRGGSSVGSAANPAVLASGTGYAGGAVGGSAGKTLSMAATSAGGVSSGVSSGVSAAGSGAGGNSGGFQQVVKKSAKRRNYNH